MKRITHFVVLTIALAMTSHVAMMANITGVGVWPDYPGTDGVSAGLVLNKSSEYTLNTIDSEEFSLNGPGAQVSFSAKRQTAGVNPLRVGQYIDGKWEEVSKFDISTNYAEYGPVNIDKRATKIKIYTTTGATLKKYFKNLKVTQATFVGNPSVSNIAVGTAKLNAANDSKTFTLDWCNVAAFTAQISGTDASLFAAQIVSGNASAGKWGQMTVKVTYKHTAVGNHSATLTLTSGNQKKTVSLTGVTQKKDQVISWGTDWSATKPSIPVGKEVTGAASATSGLTVTYESSDENIIAITQEGQAFKAIAAGEVTITAKQAGDGEWAEATSISKTFVATEKGIQVLVWDQTFTRLKTTDEPIVLQAKVMIQDPQTGELIFHPIRTAMIEYVSGNSTIVAVADTILTIVGEGETTLTARIAGDEYLESAEMQIPVRVRVPSTGCEDVWVENDLTEAYEFWHFSATTSMEKIVTINRSTGVPDKMTFQHRRLKWAGFSGGDIEVYESTDGGQTWSNKLYGIEPQLDNYTTSEQIQLSRTATHIKFFRPSSATGYHYVKDVQITSAKYLEATPNTITIDKSIVGDIIHKEITIQFSNVKDELSVSHNDSLAAISVTENVLETECGDFGSKTIHITIIPIQAGEITDTIVVTDAVSGMQCSIPVVVATQLDHQSITWELDDTHSYNVGDSIALTATASSGLEVSYTVADSTVAVITYSGDDTYLIMVKEGSTQVSAHQDGDTRYCAAIPVQYTIQVEPLLPTALNMVTYADQAKKFIQNGRMYIRYQGRIYNTLGQEIQ